MNRQRGAAVIVAMLIVALAAMAASAAVFRNQVEWRKLENRADLDQARWVLRTAEQWAAAVLADDARNSSIDYLGEAWAQKLPPVEAEGYRLSGHIEDQNGRFNLNNLAATGKVDNRQLAIFRRLLKTLHLPEGLAANIADWIDADDVRLQADSAESDYYLKLDPPYRAANRRLVSVNELSRVKDMNQDILQTLRPFVTALPMTTLINVNTAAPEVLAALVEGLSLDQAYQLAATRDRSYYRNTTDFTQALPQGLSAPADLISVSSSYFLVTANATHGRISLGSRALLQRGGPSVPSLIWRTSL